jgi:hypothetical protein
VGNNILPTLPELDLVFDDPTVRGKHQMKMQIPLALGLIATHVIPSAGALQSILGPEYMMHAHRHCHDRSADSSLMSGHCCAHTLVCAQASWLQGSGMAQGQLLGIRHSAAPLPQVCELSAHSLA